MGIPSIEVESMMMPIDKRLKMAMKPLDLEGFIDRHPTMFNWRIRVVLGSGEWKQGEASLMELEQIWASVKKIGFGKLIKIDIDTRHGRWRIK